jgi:hypothetical protein
MSDFIANLIAAIIVIVIEALVVMIIWNLAIPEIFEGVKALDFGSAIAVTTLATIFFKSNINIKKE